MSKCILKVSIYGVTLVVKYFRLIFRGEKLLFK